MKVCHIASAHRRYNVRIFHRQCVSLRENGYDTVLLINDTQSDETVKGVQIVSTGFNSRKRWKRLLFERKPLFQKALEIDADLYHIHEPSLLPIGRKLKKRGKVVVFDSHENVPGQIMMKKWIPTIFRPIISWAYSRFEAREIKCYDAVVIVTPNQMERFSSLCPVVAEVRNYPLRVKQEDVVRMPERAVCFAGGITNHWLHENVIKAIEPIEGLTYLLAGKEDKSYIESIQKLDGWRSVEYIGLLPFEKVPSLYARSIAGICITEYTENVYNKIGSMGNGKFFEYMSWGLPVICTDFLLWKQVIEEHHCGICVNPHSTEEIGDAIKTLLNDPALAEEMGKNAFKASQECYNWDNEKKKLFSLYEELLMKDASQ